MTKQLLNKWWAEYYDKEYNKSHDLGLIKELCNLSGKQKIFEVCCGSGRILIPLAKQGHDMYGIEIDNYMLSQLFEKAYNLENINVKQANAITSDWGNDYDVVLVSFNILTNIEHGDCDENNQYKFIKKAYDALKPGGYMYVDCYCIEHPEKHFKTSYVTKTSNYGADSNGNTLKNICKWTKYNIEKRILSYEYTLELTTKDGKVYTHEDEASKHFPTLEDLTAWVEKAGFDIVHLWGNHEKEPISDKTDNAIFWARKPE